MIYPQFVHKMLISTGRTNILSTNVEYHKHCVFSINFLYVYHVDIVTNIYETIIEQNEFLPI